MSQFITALGRIPMQIRSAFGRANATSHADSSALVYDVDHADNDVVLDSSYHYYAKPVKSNEKQWSSCSCPRGKCLCGIATNAIQVTGASAVPELYAIPSRSCACDCQKSIVTMWFSVPDMTNVNIGKTFRTHLTDRLKSHYAKGTGYVHACNCTDNLLLRGTYNSAQMNSMHKNVLITTRI